METEIHNKRRNLLKQLTDEESMKKYLHPKERSAWSILKIMFKPFKKDFSLIMSAIFYAITAGMIPVISAFAIKWIISVVDSLTKLEITDFSQARPLLITAGLYCLIYFVFYVISNQLELRVFSKFMYTRMGAVSTVLRKYTTMELGLFEDARFLNAIGSAADAVEGNNVGIEGIYHEMYGVTKTVFSFIVFSVILMRTNVFIPIIAIFSIILVYVSEDIYSRVRSESTPKFQKNYRIASNINAKASDFNYGKDVRVFNMGDSFKVLNDHHYKEHEILLKDLRKTKYKAGLLKALAFVILEVGIIYVLAKSYYNASIGISDLVMLLSMVGIYSTLVFEIARVIGFVLEQMVSVKYYYDFIESDLEIKGGREIEIKDLPNFDIRFEDVWFKYPGSDNWVLEGLDLEIKEGESFALVGVNGAGKSTLVSLVSGLYQPVKGRITIGGIDISTISQDSLNRMISVLLQDFLPLATKVKENVSASSENIDDEKVIESLKKAGIYEKIASFEKGIDSTMLRVLEDDGLVLSGGENQKLAIARALYKDRAGLLILDEPTSALDALAEEQIYKEFQDMIEGKTAIFISHRLASTRFCDKIVLLDGGKIRQMGTHDELLGEEGLYKEMYETQASYYKEDYKKEEVEND